MTQHPPVAMSTAAPPLRGPARRLTAALVLSLALPLAAFAPPHTPGAPSVTAKAAVTEIASAVGALFDFSGPALDELASRPAPPPSLLPASLWGPRLPFGAPSTPAAIAPAAQSALATPLAPMLQGLSGELEALTDTALDSVVAIQVWQPQRAPQLQMFPGLPFGVPPGLQPPPRPQDRQPTGQGSGVVVSADGVIITNNHVVDAAERLRVSFSDGRTAEATVVGTDPATDVAVLRLATPLEGLRPMIFADSDAVRPGALCLAIGNPFGLSSSVSLGIVSATGRDRVGINDFEDFIQTDAAINPGNSGGALIDVSGRLIGLNSAIFSRSGGSQGIGFAIPANMVSDVMDELLETGHVSRGWLGVRIDELPAKVANAYGAPEGSVVIASLEANGPAAVGGLRAGDIVTAIDGERVASTDAFRQRIAALDPGHRARLDVLRSGAEERVQVELGERPEAR